MWNWFKQYSWISSIFTHHWYTYDKLLVKKSCIILGEYCVSSIKQIKLLIINNMWLDFGGNVDNKLEHLRIMQIFEEKE